MGHRNEQRIAISFPVVVYGSDSFKSPFTITTETLDISCNGACLKGLEGFVEAGQKVEIECQDQRAWFRVQWVGENGSPKSGRVGVRSLEPGRYIWGVQPKEWEADAYDPNKIAAAAQQEPLTPASVTADPWKGGERRQFARHACRIEAQVAIPGDSVRLPGKVTDISLGGCYVDMMAPLPVDTIVDLWLNLDDVLLRMSGKVRSSQMGMGMGLSFTRMSPENFQKLRRFAPSAPPTLNAAAPGAASVPPTQPNPRPAPLSIHATAAAPPKPNNLPTTAEALEAVVRVLFRKGVLTRTELSEELEKLRTVKA